MQFLAKDLHITNIHFYAVRPEYCHEHHLYESLGNPERTDSGIKAGHEQWISDLDVTANRKFKPTSAMTMLRYCLDAGNVVDTPKYRIPQRSISPNMRFHAKENYYVKT